MSIAFPTFTRFAAVLVDGDCLGYMVHESQIGTKLHVSRRAPEWLARVRTAGPFSCHAECQAAIRAAYQIDHAGPHPDRMKGSSSSDSEREKALNEHGISPNPDGQNND